ncbi:MAG: tetraacyldisaccharide 4'-kinase [Pelagibacterales bacterium]|jgi:tetraacyldisaccharide 4'-kinase|nr:tetraacyldisaccharide 4'-kinase [Pelagibacterales bacterium]
MKFAKPKFWEEKNNLISILLFPVSLFLQILLNFRKIFISEKIFKIPIICVGNIYLGGTGKTPLCIWIAEEFIKIKKKPAIIKKYYIQHKDEHLLIKKNVGTLFLNKNRANGIDDAEAAACNIAILDDGFQDHSIKKNLNILCFNSSQLVGNGMTLPSGPLREKLDSINKAKIIVINGEKNAAFEAKILNISNKTNIFYSEYVPSNIDQFKGKMLFAFAGIGNPNNFFDLLRKNNLNVKKTLAFPDHYEFSKSELQRITDQSIKDNLELVTTEKDYLRIKKFNFKNIKYLKVKLNILEKERLKNKILMHL